MIRATSADLAEVQAFLAPLASQAMFPLNNLLHHGMDGEDPYSVSIWLDRREGRIAGLLCQTRAGMIMPVLPLANYAAAADVLRGRAVSGFVGPRDWVRGVQTALGLKGPASLDQDEPHFLLHGTDLHVPEGPGQIEPLDRAPAATIRGWMLDYHLHTLGTPPDRAEAAAGAWLDRAVATQSHVVLMDGGEPLAMTGFNARIPGMVQIGGVYTPPPLRAQGHARRAVGLHIRASGAERAVLFAAGPAAIRAYQAIGFRQIGHWSLVLLRQEELA